MYFFGSKDSSNESSVSNGIKPDNVGPGTSSVTHLAIISMKWVVSFGTIGRITCNSILAYASILVHILWFTWYNAYKDKSIGRTTSSIASRIREQTGDEIHRLRSLFGFGWFFEWEGGRHPLNSTWPWSNVKPSVLVLWGVCWMFTVASKSPSQRDHYTSRSQPWSLEPSQQPGTGSSRPQGSRLSDILIIKKEPRAQTGHHCSAVQRRDWSSKPGRPRIEAPQHQPPRSPQKQSIPVDTHSLGARYFQADTSTYTPPTAVMPGITDNDFYLAAPNITYGRASPDIGTATLTSPPAAHLSQPQILGSPGSQHQSNHHEPYRYESLRHGPRPQYNIHQPGFQSVYTSTPTFHHSPAAMSLSYETRTFSDYPQSAMMHDPNQDHEDNNIQHHRYPSPPPPLSDNPYNPQSLEAAAVALAMELPHKDDSDPPSPGRSKPIPKPDREVTKDENGRFICTHPGCTEEIRAFNRKCEWSKHMDKHDRPYKCPHDGCEKLPGFTYSGGLLRHQREVHNLHGGPRKQLNCPHPNCKRFSGKGFSRQENLNEHLRRVHTDAGELANVGGEETEEEVEEHAGMKRKRTNQRDDSADLRQEMARLRTENEELRKQSENMMRQLNQLQNLIGGRLQQQQQQQQQQQHPHQAPQVPQTPQAPQAPMM